MAGIWLLIGGGLLLFYVLYSERKEINNRFLIRDSVTKTKRSIDNENAVNLRSLYDESLAQKLINLLKNVQYKLGSMAHLKILLLMTILGFLALYINNSFVRGNFWLVLIIVELIGLYVGYQKLENRHRTKFDTEFPDALNMLTSAISSGESLMQAIIYVGKTLDGEVGKEFKLMGERLKMGELPEAVFKKACKRFPYPAFYFFVITMRANMKRGGQLKELMVRLNRIMFDARAVEKKKYAMTSEARISAKIVAAIPFVFLFMLQYLSPENYEYVMSDPQGRMILYYLLASELIGIAIVWGLMKGVEV